MTKVNMDYIIKDAPLRSLTYHKEKKTERNEFELIQKFLFNRFQYASHRLAFFYNILSVPAFQGQLHRENMDEFESKVTQREHHTIEIVYNLYPSI